MRKIVLFMMLMIGVASADAQWKVTPEAGMNVTKYKGEGAKSGFKAGAAVSYTFESKWFSLQSGLYYVQRGKAQYTLTDIYGTRLGKDGKRYYANISVYPASGGNQGGWLMSGANDGYGNDYGYGDGYHDNGYVGYEYTNVHGYDCAHDLNFSDFQMEGISTYRDKERRGYLQLPVMARFNWDVRPDIRLHLAAGPYFAFGVAGEYSLEVKDWREGNLIPSSKKESWSPYNNEQSFDVPRFDWGMGLEIGVEIKRISFKLGYDMGFGKNYRYDDFAMKYQTVSFTVGYTF